MHIGLGDRVKDRITGCQGIVIARTEWLYGCIRLVVQPEELKDGKPVDNLTIDEPQAELLVSGVIVNQAQAAYSQQPARTHGDRQNVERTASHSR